MNFNENIDKSQLIDIRTNQDEDYQQGGTGTPTKMNKFNMLRNLSKINKFKDDTMYVNTNNTNNEEKKRSNYSPENIKEEVYKKGMKNVIQTTNFLKNRESSHQFKDRKVSPQNIVKESIKSYIKRSKDGGNKLENSTNFDYNIVNDKSNELNRPTSSKQIQINNEARKSNITLLLYFNI